VACSQSLALGADHGAQVPVARARYPSLGLEFEWLKKFRKKNYRIKLNHSKATLTVSNEGFLWANDYLFFSSASFARRLQRSDRE
jgi:hypothetical protein